MTFNRVVEAGPISEALLISPADAAGCHVRVAVAVPAWWVRPLAVDF